MLQGRLFMAARFSWGASALLANRSTFLVALFAAPIFEVFTAYFLGRVLGSPSATDIALRGLLISVTLMTATFFVATVAHNRETGVLTQIISYKPLDLRYISGVILAAVSVATAAGLVNLLCLAAILPGSLAIFSVLEVFPLALFLGVAVGILCSLAVFTSSDPYVALNLCIPFLPLSAGLLVPLREYPAVIRSILRFIPPARSLEEIGSKTHVFVLSDYLVSAVALLMGLLVLRRVARQCRNNGSFQSH